MLPTTIEEMFNTGRIEDKSLCPIIPRVEEKIHGGMYLRVTTIPPNTFIEGATHKKDAISILLKGTIIQIDGRERYQISAPSFVTTNAGTSRQAFSLTEVSYATITATDETDLNKIEEVLYEEESINTKARKDYDALLLELNMTQEQVEEDMNKFPVLLTSMEGFKRDISALGGYGMFTTKEFKEGEILGVMYDGENKTLLGRYTNHAPTPNVTYLRQDGKVYMKSKYDLPIGVELFLNYRESLRCLRQ
jgi:hypothetical protein